MRKWDKVIVKTGYERWEVAIHNNMLYRKVMDEESNQLAKRAFKHSLGEVWHIDSCPDNPGLFTSTFGEKSGVGGWRKGGGEEMGRLGKEMTSWGHCQ